MKITPQAGVMTLSLLMILSSVLLLLLLFDDDNLRLHSAITAQRQQYVAESYTLQQQSRQEKLSRCEQIPVTQSGNVQLIRFQIEKQEQGLQQFFYCQRSALFKQSPVKNTYEKQFSNYINQEKIAEFRPHFTLPQNGAQSSEIQLYWFNEPNAQWEISGNVNGIIVSEGNLTIRGKGTIRGSVILGGTLTLDNVALSYRKANVTHIVQHFSQWQLAEKSWYDFIPL